MIQSVPASQPRADNPLPNLGDEDPQAERPALEGWPALRGTAAQRDRRFVRSLLKAQLVLVRGAR